jgi:hypothetical protein
MRSEIRYERGKKRGGGKPSSPSPGSAAAPAAALADASAAGTSSSEELEEPSSWGIYLDEISCGEVNCRYDR